MIPVLILPAGCGTIFRTEIRLPPERFEIDCPVTYETTEIEAQIEGMKTAIKCERSNNAGQREYRRRVME